MIGQIESINIEARTGVIKSDAKLFEFNLDEWNESVPPDVGDEVNFVQENMTATQVKLLGTLINKSEAKKRKYLAIFLAIFLGWLGIHRLYLGYYRIALMQMGLSAILINSGFMAYAPQWGFIDALLLFSGNLNKDAKGFPLK